jgi:hypothetical protein
MPRFKLKPPKAVEARRWTGENFEELAEFAGAERDEGVPDVIFVSAGPQATRSATAPAWLLRREQAGQVWFDVLSDAELAEEYEPE